MRDILIDILHERMDYHKDKFISPIILQELNGLEIKKNRVDHSSTTHDDQIFSMLMALYVWYYGKDIMANFGIRTYNIRTDEDYQESMIDNEKNTSYVEVLTDNTENSEEVQEQIDTITKGSGILHEQFLLKQKERDSELVRQLMSNKLFKMTYMKEYNMNSSMEAESGFTIMPDYVFREPLFNDDEYDSERELNKQFASMGDMR